MDPNDRWDALREPSGRRWARRVQFVLVSLASIAVILVATIWIGDRYGANQLFGERVDAGRTGAEIYARNCMQCHGAAGHGDNRVGAPAFTAGGRLQPLTFAERVEKVGRGRPLRGMPRFEGKLTPDEIRKVAAYTQILSGDEPEPGVEGVR